MKKLNIKMLGLVIGFLVFVGCATVEVPMQITHPAEIDMKGFKKLAIGEFKGNTGDDLVRGIKTGLSSEKFELVDRATLDQVMRELKLNYSDLANKNETVKLGQLMAASAIVTGSHSSNYKEDMTRESAKCYRDNKEYACTHYKRIGVANTSGAVDIVDVTTGKILISKMLGGRCQDETSAFDATPAPIDGNRLIGMCLNRDVTTVIRTIQPWKETVIAEFEKDGDVPDYERAINKIQIGDTEEGIKMLQMAISTAEKNPKIKAKVIAVGYWNLGLIYEYTWEYDKAIAAFKQGFSLHDQSRFIQEINRTSAMKKEREKLLKQQESAIYGLPLWNTPPLMAGPITGNS